MAKILIVDDEETMVRSLAALLSAESYDVVLCTGGLYHLSNPSSFLEKVRNHVRQYLVVQSVVSLESDDPDYFVAPAPGRKHGCRFSAAYFVRMLSKAGFHMLEYGFNHLEGNDRPCDRGSCYALCSVEAEPLPGKASRYSDNKRMQD